MSNANITSLASVGRWGAILLLAAAVAAAPSWAGTTLTIMTRNMDAGTDLNYIFAATDQASFVQGAALTLAEVKASGIPERAAALAEEIRAANPDLIALQEVTLWRTGPLMQPPATDIMYDQLSLLLAELGKRNLHYGIVAIQTQVDAEAPVPSENMDIRLTDRDVILARLDLPQSQFDLQNAQSHRYQATFSFGSATLGQVAVPRGWMSVDVAAGGAKLRFVNTHMESTVPGLPDAEKTQLAQADELVAALSGATGAVVVAGDFNANAETGPDHTGTVQKILNAGFFDAWRGMHPGEAGYTWPLFGEDQASGPMTPVERIDLIFTRNIGTTWFGRDTGVISASYTGMTKPAAGAWTSDHAGLVVKLQMQ